MGRHLASAGEELRRWDQLPFDGRLDCGPEEDAYIRRLWREIERLRQDLRYAQQELRRMKAQKLHGTGEAKR